MIYGITGKIASGKNHVSEVIKSYGFEVLDLDEIAKDSYSVLADRIKQEFGTTDRRSISKIVFNNPSKLSALETIIFPFVKKYVQDAEKDSEKPIFINGALIHRAKMDQMCQAIIYVEASLKLRFTRASRRSGMSKEEFIARDRSQEDVDYVTNQYSCPVEEILNEQNTHLKMDVTNVLVKFGLIERPLGQEHELELPELAKEKVSIGPKEIQNKRSSGSKKMIIIAGSIVVIGLVVVFIILNNNKPAPDFTSPVEKPEIAPVVEQLSEQPKLEPVVIPEEVSNASEPALEVQQEEEPVEIFLDVEFLEPVQKPHLSKPTTSTDYAAEKDSRRKELFDSLPGDLGKEISNL